MSIFKKKLITSFLLLFFVIVFFMPATSYAITYPTKVWVYGTNSENLEQPVNSYSDKKSGCDNDRDYIISHQGASQTFNISDCTQITQEFSTQILKNSSILSIQPGPWPSVSSLYQNNTQKYWSIYKIYDSNKKIIRCDTIPFLSLENCQIDKNNIETNYKDTTIYLSCKKSTTEPSQPNDCTKEPVNTVTDYYPLAPLPGVGKTCTQDESTPPKTICVETTPSTNCTTDKNGNETCSPGPGFAQYLNAMIVLFIGICAVLAMIMIIMGGIQYMTSELVSGKEAGRQQVTQAILGLLLALGAYAILNTINPDLLDIGLSRLPTATITIDEEENITSVGAGTIIDGKLIKMNAGTAARCVGGLVAVPTELAKPGLDPKSLICSDLLNKIKILRGKNPGFVITSTTTGTHQSQCHSNINPPEKYPTTGNCADIGLRGSGSWDDLCKAVVTTGGLNFANEAVTDPNSECYKLKPYHSYQYTNGNHLHVNFTGVGSGTNTTATSTDSVSTTYDKKNKRIDIIINNFDENKSPYIYEMDINIWSSPRFTLTKKKTSLPVDEFLYHNIVDKTIYWKVLDKEEHLIFSGKFFIKGGSY